MSAPKSPQPGSFAHALRSLRLASGLSQEEVAGRAQLSVNAIGLLERGDRRAPRRKTTTALATALNLDVASHRMLEASARRGRAATNLPRRSTSFVGRAAQIQEIARLLEGNPVVTIVGAGGLGKTRAAIEAGDGLRSGLFESVWLADISQVRERQAVFDNIAAAMHVPANVDDPLNAILAHLANWRVLLIIDNAEHVRADVAELVEAFAEQDAASRILVTSRDVLGVPSEHVYRLPPMSFPRDAADTDCALLYDAVALFVERLQTGAPDVVPAGDQLGAIVEICSQVEGNPLAIELAAARAGALGIAHLRGGLDRQLVLLRGGPQTAPQRHRSLEDTIAWSYGLLTTREQALVRRLAIFASSFTTKTVTGACADDIVPRTIVPDLIRSLVDKSLVVTFDSGGGERMRLQQATREFMERKLVESGERGTMQRRLALEMAELAARASQMLWWTPRMVWHATYQPELENARSAVCWATDEGGEPIVAARILSGLRSAWPVGGYAVEMRAQLSALIARIGTRAASDVQALLHRALVLAMAGQGDAFNAIVGTATSAFETAGDEGGLALLRAQSAVEFAATGRGIDAVLASTDALRRFRRIGATTAGPYVRAVATHAALLVEQGRLDEAKPFYNDARAIASELRDRYLDAFVAAKAAMLHYAEGDIPHAVRTVQNVLAARVFAAGGHEEAALHADLAGFRISIGDYSAGARAARLAVSRNRYLSPVGHFLSLNALAAALALSGNVAAARRHLLLAAELSGNYGWEIRTLERNNLRRGRLLAELELA
jgi:predicted ATPase/DNA-binding XRE family transcriptional regulator